MNQKIAMFVTDVSMCYDLHTWYGNSLPTNAKTKVQCKDLNDMYELSFEASIDNHYYVGDKLILNIERVSTN